MARNIYRKPTARDRGARVSRKARRWQNYSPTPSAPRRTEPVDKPADIEMAGADRKACITKVYEERNIDGSLEYSKRYKAH